MTAGDGSRVSTRRQFLRAGATVAVGTVAGCTTFAPRSDPPELGAPTTESRALPERPETIFMADIERTGHWPDRSVPDDVTLAWSIPDINRDDHTAAKPSPLYHDGAVIVPGDTATIHSISPGGNHNWTASLHPSDNGTHSTPAIVDDYLFTAGYDGAVYAFDVETGQRRWRTKVADAIGSSPVYYGGVVYVATEFYDPSGGMAALDATTGGLIWTDTRMTNHAHSITGIDTETRRFAAGCNDGSLYVWNLDAVTNPDETTFVGAFETGDAIKGPICLYDGKAIFGSWDGTVYAVDTETVTWEWSYDTHYSVMSGGAVHPDSDTVFFGTHGDEVIALDIDSGQRQWRFETDGWIVGGVTVAGDTVLAGSHDSTLYAVDVDDGGLRWAFEMPTGELSSAPLVHDGDIYVSERAPFSQTGHRLGSGHLYKLTGV